MTSTQENRSMDQPGLKEKAAASDTAGQGSDVGEPSRETARPLLTALRWLNRFALAGNLLTLAALAAAGILLPPYLRGMADELQVQPPTLTRLVMQMPAWATIIAALVGAAALVAIDLRVRKQAVTLAVNLLICLPLGAIILVYALAVFMMLTRAMSTLSM
jgi:hypothetical protein